MREDLNPLWKNKWLSNTLVLLCDGQGWEPIPAVLSSCGWGLLITAWPKGTVTTSLCPITCLLNYICRRNALLRPRCARCWLVSDVCDSRVWGGIKIDLAKVGGALVFLSSGWLIWFGRSTYVLSVDQPGACLTSKSLTVVNSVLGSDWSE